MNHSLDLFIIREHHEIIGSLISKEENSFHVYIYRIKNKENEFDENNRQRKHSTNRIDDTFKFREYEQRWSKVHNIN